MTLQLCKSPPPKSVFIFLSLLATPLPGQGENVRPYSGHPCLHPSKSPEPVSRGGVDCLTELNEDSPQSENQTGPLGLEGL